MKIACTCGRISMGKETPSFRKELKKGSNNRTVSLLFIRIEAVPSHVISIEVLLCSGIISSIGVYASFFASGPCENQVSFL